MPDSALFSKVVPKKQDRSLPASRRPHLTLRVAVKRQVELQQAKDRVRARMEKRLNAAFKAMDHAHGKGVSAKDAEKAMKVRGVIERGEKKKDERKD